MIEHMRITENISLCKGFIIMGFKVRAKADRHDSKANVFSFKNVQCKLFNRNTHYFIYDY